MQRCLACTRPLSHSLLASPLLPSFLRVAPISTATVERSKELLEKYIADRKNYERPSPFKNITPIAGGKRPSPDDLYTFPSSSSSSSAPRFSSPKPKPRPSRGEDMGAKSNKYTPGMPGYTPANLHTNASTIVNPFAPPSAKSSSSSSSSSSPSSASSPFSDSEAFSHPGDQPSVTIPLSVLEESIERVAGVAILLKKNEIQGPEAAEQLIEHIKLLLQLRMSMGDEGGEMGEEGGEGEEGSENELRENEEMELQPQEEYGKADYWDARYTKHPAPLDWYQSYNNLRPTLRRKIRPFHKILMVGCGNSTLSEEMYNDGLKNIVNIDVSKVVLDLMSNKNKDKSEMTYQLSDATNMPEVTNESFDMIIDKGTYDALVHGGKTDHIGYKMLKEISRVLKKGGSFFLITHGDEEFRRPLFDLPEFGWTIDVQPLRYKETDDVFTYVYTMTKT